MNVLCSAATRTRSRHLAPRAERGVVLFIALLVMVALSLAGIALIRSVDTATIVTGNLAFKQAAAASVDRGFEQAIERLFNPVPPPGVSSPVIDNKLADNTAQNYFASVRRVAGDIPEIPAELASRKAFLDARLTMIPADDAGNAVMYVIERMCSAPGPAVGSNCNLSSSALGADAGTQHYEGLGRPGDAYYRVTVRVEGPRKTVAYAQAIVR